MSTELSYDIFLPLTGTKSNSVALALTKLPFHPFSFQTILLFTKLGLDVLYQLHWSWWCFTCCFQSLSHVGHLSWIFSVCNVCVNVSVLGGKHLFVFCNYFSESITHPILHDAYIDTMLGKLNNMRHRIFLLGDCYVPIN